MARGTPVSAKTEKHADLKVQSINTLTQDGTIRYIFELISNSHGKDDDGRNSRCDSRAW